MLYNIHINAHIFAEEDLEKLQLNDSSLPAVEEDEDEEVIRIFLLHLLTLAYHIVLIFPIYCYLGSGFIIIPDIKSI